MKIDVFSHHNYKAYLKAWTQIDSGGKRGSRSRLAKQLRCHTAYISRVLNHDAHLSLEQAETFNSLAGHTREEAEFFLLLVQSARASTPALRERISLQIETAKEKRLLLRNRVKIEATLSPANQLTYYSTWLYAAVHVLVTIPRFRDATTISEHFRIPRQRVEPVLEFLVSCGLLERDKNGYNSGTTKLFLGSDSPSIARHHANWRLKAMESLDRSEAKDLHLSTVLSLSQKDALRAKEILIRAIQEVRELAHASKEEEVHCFNADFFAV